MGFKITPRAAVLIQLMLLCQHSSLQGGDHGSHTVSLRRGILNGSIVKSQALLLTCSNRLTSPGVYTFWLRDEPGAPGLSAL